MSDTTASASRRATLSGPMMPPPRFTEREPYERGFSALFDAEIAPRLAELEIERQSRKRDFLRRLALCGLGLPAIVLALAYFGDTAYLGITFFVAIFGLAACGWLVAQPKRGFRDAVRRAVLPTVCRFLGDLQHARGRDATIDLRRFADSGVVGSFTRAAVDDAFTGRYREVGFAMAETTLRRRSPGRRIGSRYGGRRRRQTTVFRGLLIAVEVPKAFPGRILLGRDYGSLGNALAGWFKQFGGMQRVELPHRRFEALFAVYSDQPEAARAFLTPAFLDSWVAVAEAYQGSAIRAAFVGGEFLAALPIKRNLFESGSLWTPTDRIEDDLHKVLWEVSIAHRLIDFLHGDRPKSLI